MANRRRKGLENAANIFDRKETDDPFDTRVDPLETDRKIYGGTPDFMAAVADVDELRRAAIGIDIFEIFPDHSQPRRTIPSPLRKDWDGQPATVPALLRAWLDAIRLERGDDGFDLSAHLLSNETERYTTYHLALESDESASEPETVEREAGILETALLPIVDLAASIRRDGLTNPITVVQTGRTYRLETGERRWLAFHLLRMWADETKQDKTYKYEKILANTVKKVDVWRQASENNARADLNAIGKARQFALLLMDILQEEDHAEFEPYTALVKPGVSDRLYYAQVAHGGDYRIPRNKGEKLLNAIGLKNGKQLKQHRALLRLPDSVWRIADDLNWTEGKLRELVKLIDDEPQKAIKLACQWARKEGYMGSIDPICDEDTPDSRDAKAKSAAAPRDQKKVTEISKRVHALLSITADDVAGFSADAKRDLQNEIRLLRTWIDEISDSL